MLNIVAMNHSLYNPFKSFDFRNDKCFLSGNAETPVAARVLPDWLLQMADLTGQEQIKLLDESVRNYQSLVVPVNGDLYQSHLIPLEQQIETAFAQGYRGVSALPELTLFQWIGKMMYSFLYIEMQGAIRLKQLSGDGMNMSQGLMHKFGNLHLMLQSIFREVEFEEFTPWSIVVVPLEKIDTHFSFRDEINTLIFSLKFKDFGIVASLQDNGTNKRYHQQLLDSTKDKVLTDQQFEELAARFFYSAYLFNRLPEYNIIEANDVAYIDPMPLRGIQNKPIFDQWENKTYGQVLENFWKPYDLTLFEIIKNPKAPISFFDPPLLPDTH
jgi:hypothetical protein